MEKLIKVAINDFKLVFRDSSLNFFFIFPVLNLFVVRFGFPYIVGKFDVLEHYVPILLMFLANQGSLIFGFIYSMVLIEENDLQVAKVYGILPVSKFWFIIFRLIAPFFFSTLATFLMLTVEPYYFLPIFINVVYSTLVGLLAPLMVLFVAIMAKNKLEGMTWQKLFNIPVMLPILAFFVPASFSFIFAIFPTFWAYQGFNKLVSGESYILYLMIGFIFNIVLIILMAKKFTKTHFQ